MPISDLILDFFDNSDSLRTEALVSFDQLVDELRQLFTHEVKISNDPSDINSKLLDSGSGSYSYVFYFDILRFLLFALFHIRTSIRNNTATICRQI